MSDTQLISNQSLLAVAHGPGVDVAADPALNFLDKGATFTKYHRQSSLLSSSAKRFLFYQHNHLFFTKPNTSRPAPGEETKIDAQYQTSLVDINEIVVGKSASTFKTRAASNVPAERAWSLIVTRKSGEVEHVDFEAASQQERDAWTSALTSLVAKAKANKAEHETAIKVVSVKLTVDGDGLVSVSTEPVTSQESATAPLAIETTAASHSTADDDTPTDEDVRAARAVSASAASSAPVETETVRLDTPTPTVVTITTTDSGAQQQRIVELEAENSSLKSRIAELEAKLAAADSQ